MKRVKKKKIIGGIDVGTTGCKIALYDEKARLLDTYYKEYDAVHKGGQHEIDFERLSKIQLLIDVPIVMHGGSGIDENDYREVIKRGVRKVNYYTYMAQAGGKAISDKEYAQFHDALKDAELAMKNNVINAIKIFSQN